VEEDRRDGHHALPEAGADLLAEARASSAHGLLALTDAVVLLTAAMT
jgi:hypothetical protein